MAAGTLISREEYLHTSYCPDCEYADGKPVERNVEGVLKTSNPEIAISLPGIYRSFERA